MSVTFIYRQKMDFSICDKKVGFPKYVQSHIQFIYVHNILKIVTSVVHGQLTVMVSTLIIYIKF